MNNDELYLFRWTFYADGTSDPQPLPIPGPSQEPPPLVDIDKLIEESSGLYLQWWMLFKENLPDRCLIGEEPKEPIIKAPPKQKVTFQPLACKRCQHEWTPRRKDPPVQCTKCHSPYWNRERKR